MATTSDMTVCANDEIGYGVDLNARSAETVSIRIVASVHGGLAVVQKVVVGRVRADHELSRAMVMDLQWTFYRPS